jgi:hypothetical protein
MIELIINWRAKWFNSSTIMPAFLLLFLLSLFLSVQPLLEAKYEILDKMVEVFIENIGVGNAKVTEYNIFVDGKEIELLDEVLKDFGKDNKIPGAQYKLEKFNTPRFIRPNDRIIIFYAYPLSDKIFNSTERAQFLEITKRFNVLIAYKSIYNEEKNMRFDAI